MSVQIAFEADPGFTADVATRVLQSLGVVMEPFKRGFKGTFPEKNLWVHFAPRDRAEELSTDGMENATWLTQSSVLFSLIWSEKASCGRQIFAFVQAVVEKTPVRFVVSVQREEILSLRDERGVQHFGGVWAHHFGDEGTWGAVIH